MTVIQTSLMQIFVSMMTISIACSLMDIDQILCTHVFSLSLSLPLSLCFPLYFSPSLPPSLSLPLQTEVSVTCYEGGFGGSQGLTHINTQTHTHTNTLKLTHTLTLTLTHYTTHSLSTNI